MINLNLSFGSVAEMRSTLAAILAGENTPAPVAEAPAPKPVKAAKPAPTPTVSATATPVPEPAPAEPAAASPSKVTLEEVRAKLAALSQSGKTAEVKAIITAAGVTKLTDIPADKYAEVLEKAAAL